MQYRSRALNWLIEEKKLSELDERWNRLAPSTAAALVERAMSDALESKGAQIKPYGTGDAAQKIVNSLRD